MKIEGERGREGDGERDFYSFLVCEVYGVINGLSINW
jgi:hypothetical protein